MRVRLLVSRAVQGDPQNVGDVLDVPDAEAKRMIEANQAEPIREGRKPEKATKRKAPEKAFK